MSVFDKYSCEGQMNIFDLGLWSGKTSPERSVPTAAKTSGQYSKKFAELRIKMPLFLDLRGGGGKWSTSGCILGSGEHGIYSVAWRVHDAQFWGVPQRRKRIALVADFGGNAAPEILFEREGVRGDSAESEEAREGTAGDTEENSGETIKCLNGWDVQSKHIQPENGKAEALYSGECRGGGGESYVMQSETVYCLQGNGIDRADTAGCNGKGWREDQSYTLNTIDRPAVCAAQQAIGEYKIGGVASNLKQRDYKEATDLVIQ